MISPGSLCQMGSDSNILASGIKLLKSNAWEFVHPLDGGASLPVLRQGNLFIVIAVSTEKYYFLGDRDNPAVYVLGPGRCLGWMTGRGDLNSVERGEWTLERVET